MLVEDIGWVKCIVFTFVIGTTFHLETHPNCYYQFQNLLHKILNA